MVSLYIDECVHGAIARGLLRRRIDVMTVQEDGFSHAHDEEVIRRATELGRVVFTNDPDLIEIARRLQAEGSEFSGVLFAPQRTPIGVSVTDLELVAECSDPNEWFGRISFIPLS